MYVLQRCGYFKKDYSKLRSPLDDFQECSIRNLQDTGLYFLDTAVPVSIQDYEERRQRLAQALVSDGVDAFVVEPGFTFKYYANVSQPEWEVWEVGASDLNHAMIIALPTF